MWPFIFPRWRPQWLGLVFSPLVNTKLRNRLPCNFQGFFMHICSTFWCKVNIKVYKTESKKVVLVRKWLYLAIPGTSPISVLTQNYWDIKFRRAHVVVSQATKYILLGVFVYEKYGNQFWKSSKLRKCRKISHIFWSIVPNDSVYRLVSIRCGYMVLKYDKCFLQRADSFNSNEMTHNKCFTTRMPLLASRGVSRWWLWRHKLVSIGINLKPINYCFR